MDVSHPNAHELLQTLDSSFAQSKKEMGPVAMHVRFDGTPDMFQMPEIAGKVGTLAINGSARMDTTGARPLAHADLVLGHVKLDDFLPQNGTGAKEARKAGGKRWSDRTMNFGFIRDWDGTLSIKSDRMTYGDYDLSKPTVSVAMKDGVLKSDTVTAGMMEGRLAGFFELDARAVPSLTVDMKMKGASVEEALATVAAIAPATGRFDLTGQYKAQGHSQMEMVSSLTGTGKLLAKDGVIRGLDMTKLSTRLSGLTQLKDFARLVGTALSKGETPYKRLQVDMTATNGIVDARLIEADMTATNLDAKARIDLPNWTMDVDGAMKLKEPQAAPSVGVKVLGSVSAPKIDYRTAALKKYMKQKLAEALLNELLNKPQPIEGVDPLATTDPAAGLGEGEVAPPPTKEELVQKGLSFLLKQITKKPKPPEPS